MTSHDAQSDDRPVERWWYDEERSLHAELDGKPLPRHEIVGISLLEHSDDNLTYMVYCKGGSRITVDCVGRHGDPLYIVSVWERTDPKDPASLELVRSYDDRECAHARVVFWNSMCLHAELTERRRSKVQGNAEYGLAY